MRSNSAAFHPSIACVPTMMTGTPCWPVIVTMARRPSRSAITSTSLNSIPDSTKYLFATVHQDQVRVVYSVTLGGSPGMRAPLRCRVYRSEAGNT